MTRKTGNRVRYIHTISRWSSPACSEHACVIIIYIYKKPNTDPCDTEELKVLKVSAV